MFGFVVEGIEFKGFRQTSKYDSPGLKIKSRFICLPPWIFPNIGLFFMQTGFQIESVYARFSGVSEAQVSISSFFYYQKVVSRG